MWIINLILSSPVWRMLREMEQTWICFFFKWKKEDQKKHGWWSNQSNITGILWILAQHASWNRITYCMYKYNPNWLRPGSDGLGGWILHWDWIFSFKLVASLSRSRLHRLFTSRTLWRPSLAPSILRYRSETPGGQFETWSCKLGGANMFLLGDEWYHGMSKEVMSTFPCDRVSLSQAKSR